MCTWGSEGAWAMDVHSQTCFHCPAQADASFKVVEYEALDICSLRCTPYA